MSGSEKCQHQSLRWGSGGYYLICERCSQTWVAKRIGADRDDDFDRGETCMTPLAGGTGCFIFIEPILWRKPDDHAR